MMKKNIIKALWILAGITTVILLGAAMQQKNKQNCKGVTVEILGSDDELFLTESDIKTLINEIQVIDELPMQQINLRKIEESLEQNAWIKNAELFIDNKGMLHATITERVPIARLFTNNQASFYIDEDKRYLPLSHKLTARVPYFTGYPLTTPPATNADSLLLNNVMQIANFINADSFWTAQVAQIHILPNATFQLVPVLGNHIVELGDATDLENKFNKLFTFYKEAMVQQGINKYELLKVQFANQVVAVQRGKLHVKDSVVVTDPLLKAEKAYDSVVAKVEPKPIKKDTAVVAKTKPVTPVQPSKNKVTINNNNKLKNKTTH